MSGAELAFAASLIVAPSGTPFPEVEQTEWVGVQAAIWTTAINWEILDPRETNFIVSRREDMKNDIEILRKRYNELKGAPLLNDAKRFPERAAVSEMISFNRALRNHIDGRQHLETDRGAEHRDMLFETDRLFTFWDAVRDARCDFYYVTTRRLALKRVRDLIGNDAYYSGNLPPYVPTWRFQEKD
ncbi:MAG: hypothetical protein K8T89_26455 [Planctomycetes bacterium]|nr:hypothetical protein [Planctomycetota bacterium]